MEHEIVNGPERKKPLPERVFVSVDTGIEAVPEFMSAVERGVRQVCELSASKKDVKLVGSKWDDGAYGSTKWFLDRSRLSNGQIDASRVLELSETDPTTKLTPHMGLMLISEDLTSSYNGTMMNFIFGSSRADIGMSIQSISRYLDKTDSFESTDEFLETIELVARHEFGHLFGLVSVDAINHDPRGGINTAHCINNACTMNQIHSVAENIAKVRELRHKQDKFCKDCRDYLKTR